MPEHGEFLLTIIGVVCVVGSIVGSGLKIGPIEFPKLDGRARTRLFRFGLLLTVAGVVLHFMH